MNVNMTLFTDVEGSRARVRVYVPAHRARTLAQHRDVRVDCSYTGPDVMERDEQREDEKGRVGGRG